MKASTTASMILGLLSAPFAFGRAHVPAPVQESLEIEEGGVTFKVSRFTDGRSTPYRIYFWDEHLTGSSYRLSPDGHVEYFKAGSEVYYDRMEMDDESLTYLMKTKTRDHRSTKAADHYPEQYLPTSGCHECKMVYGAVCETGMPAFCDRVRRYSLGDDGFDSVEILCGSYEGACAQAEGYCAYVCAAEEGEYSTCDNGFIGVQASNGACCSAGCGPQCGGVGCSSFGKELGLDKYDCCSTEIVDMGKPCSEAGKAPCYIDNSSDDSGDDDSGDAMKCDNGLVGVQASNGACCDAGCGQCGGVGCSSFGKDLGLDKYDCCSTEIIDYGKPCSEAGKAPCFLDDSNNAGNDDLGDVIMGSSDSDSNDADSMDAECQRASLTAADLEGLDVYDFDMYIEPGCKETGGHLPNGCNFMGLGQGCRGCYATCEGALYYIKKHKQEIAEKGEDVIINFCPDSGLSSLDQCREI